MFEHPDNLISDGNTNSSANGNLAQLQNFRNSAGNFTLTLPLKANMFQTNVVFFYLQSPRICILSKWKVILLVI